MNIVVGSGPAGVSCAMALLARNCQVVMLDAALQEAAKGAGVGLSVEDGAVFISYEPS